MKKRMLIWKIMKVWFVFE